MSTQRWGDLDDSDSDDEFRGPVRATVSVEDEASKNDNLYEGSSRGSGSLSRQQPAYKKDSGPSGFSRGQGKVHGVRSMGENGGGGMMGNHRRNEPRRGVNVSNSRFGGANSRGQHAAGPLDWKKQAVESRSKKVGDAGVDGSSWMQKRHAKKMEKVRSTETLNAPTSPPKPLKKILTAPKIETTTRVVIVGEKQKNGSVLLRKEKIDKKYVTNIPPRYKNHPVFKR